MKAIVFDQPGGAEALKLGEVPRPFATGSGGSWSGEHFAPSSTEFFRWNPLPKPIISWKQERFLASSCSA